MRVAWLCMFLVSGSLAGCGEEYRLVPLTGFAGDSDPGVFGFDGDGNPVLAHKGKGEKWSGDQWLPGGVPASVCAIRNNPVEGALAFDSRMLRWQDGAFVPVSPPFRRQDGCTSAVAALTDGTLFLLGITSGDTGPAHSNLFRAQPGGTWAPAFAQTVDLGRPVGAVRDAQGHLWLLGIKGVARVAPDGQSVSVIADCSHPLYQGCQRAIEGHVEVLTTYPGVDPAGNFYFTLRRRVANDGLRLAELYRVRAGATEPELFSLSPPHGAPLNGSGYIVGPDGALWTTVSTSLESSLMKRAFGSVQWRRVMVLPWDNFHVYLSNQGRVFLVESGSVSEEGAYELVRD